MKKILQITILCIFMFGLLDAQAQIRLVAIDCGTGSITIKNFGSTPVDLTGYRFCHNFNYLYTVDNMTAVS